MHTEARQTERWSLEQRDVYRRVMQGMGGSSPKEPPAPRRFQQSILKASKLYVLGAGVVSGFVIR